MQHPKKIGDRTTLAVMLALQAADYPILLPFGENTRYDLVLDDGRGLRPVQCKTGRLRSGAVRFNACSTYGHHRHPATASRDYRGQIDLFAVHCPDNGGVYLVPIEDLAVRRHANLRVEPPKNGQRRFIRFAEDYEIAKIDIRSSQPVERANPVPGGVAGAEAPSA